MEWLMLAGLGMGMLRGQQQQRQRKEQLQLESTRARFSPWTGRQPRQVKEVDQLGNLMQGAMAGAMFGQQFGDNPSTDTMNPEVSNKIQDYKNPWGSYQQQPGAMDYRGTPGRGFSSLG